MELKLEKQPSKYLKSVDANTRKKLVKALGQLENLEGDIVRLQGEENLYRYKIKHYRILFRYNRDGGVIRVVEINTRTNIKY